MGEIPEPDITRDKVMVVSGAAMVLVDTMYRPVEGAACWATMLPVESPEVTPRRVKVPLRTQVGTVEQHVERYRQLLTGCFSTLTFGEKNTPVLRVFGEKSLRKQTECFNRNGFAKPGINGAVYNVGPECFDALVPLSGTLLSSSRADLLTRLLASYREQTDIGDCPHPITDADSASDIRLIDRLVGELTELKALHQSYLAGQDPAESEVPVGREDDGSPTTRGPGPAHARQLVFDTPTDVVPSPFDSPE